MTLKRVD